MVDGNAVKLQLRDLSLTGGMLYLNSELCYVASGNILPCNILRSIYTVRGLSQGPVLPGDSQQFGLRLADTDRSFFTGWGGRGEEKR